MNLPVHIYDMNALKRHGYRRGSFVFLFPTVPSITSGNIVHIGSLSVVRHTRGRELDIS